MAARRRDREPFGRLGCGLARADQTRMKRFSSAQCLADRQQRQQQQQQQQVSDSTRQNSSSGSSQPSSNDESKQMQQDGGVRRTSKRRAGRRSKPSPVRAGKRQQSQANLLAASNEEEEEEEEEPAMVLARQRRPSVSNQASVNVDQQGECKALLLGLKTNGPPLTGRHRSSPTAALFSAVECNQLERAKTILENGRANVNR